MTLRNAVSLALKTSLGVLGVRLIRLTPNKVRGIEPALDLRFLLRSNSAPLIVDVGANDGEMATELLAAFPSCSLVAFEPYPDSFTALQERFKGDSRVTAQPLAIGEVPGHHTLHVFSGHRMNSMLELSDHPENMMRGKFEQTDAVVVEVDSLDRYCERAGITAIDLLKTDTQGYDLNVLRGARGLLDRQAIRAILLEVNFIPMYEKQASFVELHEYLTARGYRLVDLYNKVQSEGYTAWADACYVASPNGRQVPNEG